MQRTSIPRIGALGIIARSVCASALIAVFASAGLAQDGAEKYAPDRYGLGVTLGHTFDPVGDIGFLMLTGTALFDYDKVWRHPAPRDLRFKVEANLGGSFTPDRDLIASAGMLALYLIEPISTRGVTPYVEAGIGAIYTQHRVEEQGLHLNFNPQVGVGAEFASAEGPAYFASLRWHHISNGGFDRENRGVNSIVLVIGRYLW
ncbi:MAG: acyloxyacyl hydrolase [Desulfobacterales bacterium]